jgi:hypothetical protein
MGKRGRDDQSMLIRLNVSMKVAERIFRDATGHVTSQLVLPRWPSSTQWSERCSRVTELRSGVQAM